MTLRMSALSFALWLSSSLAFAEPSALAPLSQESRARLTAIAEEHTPPPAQHYFRSNEWFQDLLVEKLSGLGGAYVGVGSDQNYTMAALARSELLMLIDYDPRIPWVHRIYDVLVRKSATPAELIACFEPAQAEATAAALRDAFGSDANAAAMVKHFKGRTKLWHKYLERVQRTPSTWLSDASLYAHVRTLFTQGRVISRNGDLTATTTIRSIADTSQALEVPVRIVYFSNAEQFFKYTKSFRESMAALPTDERSVVIRTVHHAKLVNAKPNDPTEWHYMVQEFGDFKARMEAGYRTSFQLVHDLVHHRELTASGEALSVLNAKVPLRDKQRANAAPAAP